MKEALKTAMERNRKVLCELRDYKGGKFFYKEKIIAYDEIGICLEKTGGGIILIPWANIAQIEINN